MAIMNMDQCILVCNAMLHTNINDTIWCLNQVGVDVKNTDGTYKPFNEVMDQIYALSVE